MLPRLLVSVLLLAGGQPANANDPAAQFVTKLFTDVRVPNLGRPARVLDRVDGFYPHQNTCETDNGVVAGRCLLASHGDALEPL